MYIRAAVHLASHCIYPSLLEGYHILSNAWQAARRSAAQPCNKGELMYHISDYAYTNTR